jgi:hypothetical protein
VKILEVNEHCFARTQVSSVPTHLTDNGNGFEGEGKRRRKKTRRLANGESVESNVPSVTLHRVRVAHGLNPDPGRKRKGIRPAKAGLDRQA